MANIEYISGGGELLGEVEPLWRGLCRHHAERSKYFSGVFRDADFAARAAGLLDKARNARLRVEYARDGGRCAGYCIASVHTDGTGEIESIYVEPEFRRRGIAARLMKGALEWLDAAGVGSKLIGVACGNEEVLGFYRRFGFYPRTIILKQTGR